MPAIPMRLQPSPSCNVDAISRQKPNFPPRRQRPVPSLSSSLEKKMVLLASHLPTATPSLIALLSLIFCCWTTSPVQANLLENSSFEHTTTQETGQSQQVVTGWHSFASSGGIPALNGTAIVNNNKYDDDITAELLPIPDGSNWIDPDTGVFQNVTTVEGATYMLSFYMWTSKNTSTSGNDDNSLVVEWNGEVLKSFTSTAPGRWEQKRIEIAGKGNVEQLLLRRKTTSGPVFLDYVLLELHTSAFGKCRVPHFMDNWTFFQPYPTRVAESQGRIIGNDFVIVSGFTHRFSSATDATRALDLTQPEASWRPLAPIPVPQGITHAAQVLIGDEFYMYVCFVVVFLAVKTSWLRFLFLPPH